MLFGYEVSLSPFCRFTIGVVKSYSKARKSAYYNCILSVPAYNSIVNINYKKQFVNIIKVKCD